MERSNDRILRLEIAVSRRKALISAIAAFLAAVAAVWAGFRYARRSRRRIFFLNREIVRQEAAPSVARGPYAAEAQEDDSGEAAADSADSKGSRHGDLISRIERVLEDPEVYCDPDFSIRSLAALVDSNTKYVSQAINDTSGVNFRIVHQHAPREGGAGAPRGCLRIFQPDHPVRGRERGFPLSLQFRDRLQEGDGHHALGISEARKAEFGRT